MAEDFLDHKAVEVHGEDSSDGEAGEAYLDEHAVKRASVSQEHQNVVIRALKKQIILGQLDFHHKVIVVFAFLKVNARRPKICSFIQPNEVQKL